MSKFSSIIALAAVTVTAVVGAMLVQDDSGAIPHSGEPYLPGFLAETQRTATIE